MAELQAYPETLTSIKLTWSGPNTANAQTLIERKPTSSGAFTTVTTLDASTSTYTDAGVSTGVRYTYRITRKLDDALSAAAEVEQAPYSAPITINKGGTYEGNWLSTSSNTTAVRVTTTEPVVIKNCHIKSSQDGITSADLQANITVRDCRFIGVVTTSTTDARGRGINVLMGKANQTSQLVVENNYFENWGQAIRYVNFGQAKDTGATLPQATPNSGQSIAVRYNQFKNMDGRRGDGQGGVSTETSASAKANNRFGAGQAIALDNMRRLQNSEFAWNEIINEPGKSHVEDTITTYESGGTQASPIKIYKNFQRGQYYWDPTEDVGMSGTCINLGDAYSPYSREVAWVEAYENRCVSVMGFGMGISGGVNQRLYKNRVISAQKLPDGRIIGGQYRGGFGYQIKQANWGSPSGNTMYDNYSNVVWKDSKVSPNYTPNVPPGDTAGLYNNIDDPTGSGYYKVPISGGPTTALEEAEYTTWKSELDAAGVKLGPQRCVTTNSIKICN